MQSKRKSQRMRTESVKDIVRKRARNRCELCGSKPPRNPGGKTRGSIHHRHMRRLGGIDSVDNLILLCLPCHRDTHMNEPVAACLGVVSWVEASCTPLLHQRVGWTLLVPDGTFEPLQEGEALRLLDFVNGSAQVA